MASLIHDIWIDAPRADVYDALAVAENVGRWWDDQTVRETPDGIIWEHLPFEGHGVAQFQILERRPHDLICWKSISTHPPGVPGHGWKDTIMTFRFKDRADHAPASEPWTRDIPAQTALLFTHEGWPDDDPYLGFCNTSWALVLSNLKVYCED